MRVTASIKIERLDDDDEDAEDDVTIGGSFAVSRDVHGDDVVAGLGEALHYALAAAACSILPPAGPFEVLSVAITGLSAPDTDPEMTPTLRHYFNTIGQLQSAADAVQQASEAHTIALLTRPRRTP